MDFPGSVFCDSFGLLEVHSGLVFFFEFSNFILKVFSGQETDIMS